MEKLESLYCINNSLDKHYLVCKQLMVQNHLSQGDLEVKNMK